MRLNRRTVVATSVVLAMGLALAGCSSSTPKTTATSAASTLLPPELKFGYFPNFTHATGIIALANGYLAKELGPSVKIIPVTFNAGPAAVSALFAGGVDVTLAGPNPTINGFEQSHGQALEVISGGASGGAGLVVRAGITSVAELKGKTLATPSLGNTQDVALRYFLKSHGLATTTEGGGDVHITPDDNATALQAFIQGKIDGAWEPQPWVTQMVEQGHGTELVNEKTLWPGGKFVVTNTIASKAFIQKYPAAVTDIIKAELDATDFIKAHPAKAQAIVNSQIKALTGSETDPKDLAKAWSDVDFTVDPLPGTLVESANHAKAVGLLTSTDLTGLYDLGPLNALLAARGQAKIKLP